MKILTTVSFSLLFFTAVFSQPCDIVFVEQFIGNNPPGCQWSVPIYSGTTEGYTKSLPSDDLFPCGTIENNHFTSVIPDSTGIINITFIPETCDNGQGLEVIFYDINFTPVSSCFSIDAPAQEIIKVENLVPGQVYWMMIDGIDGSECVFFFTSNKSWDPPQHIPPIVMPNINSQTICPETEICFTATPRGFSLGFNWRFTDNAQIISGGGQQDDFVCMTFDEKGFGAGAVSIILADTISNEASFYIEINDVEGEVTEIICPGDTIFKNGLAFDSAGNYEVLFKDIAPDECDSLLHLEILIPDISPVPIRCFIDSFLNALTIDWDKRELADFYEIRVNDSLISTQDYIGFILESGFPGTNLRVEVLPIGNHGCSYATGYSTCLNLISSSESISKEKEVFISPNPSNGFFEVFSKAKIDQFDIIDLSGRVREKVIISQTGTSFKIDLTNFENGVYFFKMNIEGRIIVKKIVKIR